ncbi:hypothetical protein KC346_g23396, partial [Hortaea werneckii]
RRDQHLQQQQSPPKLPPHRRPGHLSTKSSGAVPTISTLNAAPTATATATATATPPRSPTKPSRPVSRSWLGRSASTLISPTMAAPTADGHLAGQQSAAADLLRQSLLHG